MTKMFIPKKSDLIPTSKSPRSIHHRLDQLGDLSTTAIINDRTRFAPMNELRPPLVELSLSAMILLIPMDTYSMRQQVH